MDGGYAIRIKGLLVLGACLGLACNNSTPAGTESLVVYVVDAVSGGPLCNATVTANSVALLPGGETPRCYFTPPTLLPQGEAVVVAVSQANYAPTTENVVIPSTTLTLIVQLAPLDADAGSDAGVDGSMDASDASSADVATDVSTDVTADTSDE